MDSKNLVYMANQIARNLRAQGEKPAITATAAHIREYWEPRMINALCTAGPDGLDPIARAALTRINAPS